MDEETKNHLATELVSVEIHAQELSRSISEVLDIIEPILENLLKNEKANPQTIKNLTALILLNDLFATKLNEAKYQYGRIIAFIKKEFGEDILVRMDKILAEANEIVKNFENKTNNIEKNIIKTPNFNKKLN